MNFFYNYMTKSSYINIIGISDENKNYFISSTSSDNFTNDSIIDLLKNIITNTAIS